MEKSEKDQLNRKIKELQKEIKKIGPVMRGSVTIMGTKNKQPYFSVSIKGKTKVIYLGNKRAEIAQKYSQNYKRMLEIIDEMTILNMQLLKSDKT